MRGLLCHLPQKNIRGESTRGHYAEVPNQKNVAVAVAVVVTAAAVADDTAADAVAKRTYRKTGKFVVFQ